MIKKKLFSQMELKENFMFSKLIGNRAWGGLGRNHGAIVAVERPLR